MDIWAKEYGYYVYELYARFLQSFGTTVFGIDENDLKPVPSGLRAEEYRSLAAEYENIITQRGYEIPAERKRQLEMAIKSVLNSWNSEEAKVYRLTHGIPESIGPGGIILQRMVYGNLNDNSGSFVLFTRNPLTGEKGVYIEYGRKTVGIDLVSGRVTPIPLEKSGIPEKLIWELTLYAEIIEEEFGYVQDIEGVIENGKIWILQTRDAKLSPEAEAKVLVEMVEEGILTKEEALRRANLNELEEKLIRPGIAPDVAEKPIGEGLGASSGAMYGVVALSEEKAKEYKNRGMPVILVKEEVYPAGDLKAMEIVDGIVTCVGGITSHGAIVARDIGVPAVVGVKELKIDKERHIVEVQGKEIREGEYITIDGTNGFIYYGKLPLKEPAGINPDFEKLRRWEEELIRR